MLIVGFAGKELDDATRAALDAPEVSGVIFFTRNFASREQVQGLVEAIRQRRPGPFLLSVDQEGGPVQRFRAGFTRLPALARLGALYETDPAQARLNLAAMCEKLLANTVIENYAIEIV